MYTSPDEDRSDLFLAAAVFVLGPQILSIILRYLPRPRALEVPLQLLIVLATTVLTPFLLVRYRKQRWADFGFGGPVSPALIGALASVPIMAAYVLGSLARRSIPLPLEIGAGGPVDMVIDIVLTIVSAIATMLLLIYVVVKARTSFRTDPGYIKPTMRYLGRFTAIAAAAATVLLLLTVVVNQVELTAAVQVVLPPLGIAAAAWIVYRRVRGSQLTSRMILLTPMILLAIGAFTVFGQAAEVVFGLWQASLLAGVGLVAAALLESSRSAWAPLGLAAGLAFFTPLLRPAL